MYNMHMKVKEQVATVSWPHSGLWIVLRVSSTHLQLLTHPVSPKLVF